MAPHYITETESPAKGEFVKNFLLGGFVMVVMLGGLLWGIDYHDRLTTLTVDNQTAQPIAAVKLVGAYGGAVLEIKQIAAGGHATLSTHVSAQGGHNHAMALTVTQSGKTYAEQGSPYISEGPVTYTVSVGPNGIHLQCDYDGSQHETLDFGQPATKPLAAIE